jgi:hypothetical protein
MPEQIIIKIHRQEEMPLFLKVPLVTGRTGDGAYNNNQTATSVYGSNAKRILHLYNYGA